MRKKLLEEYVRHVYSLKLEHQTQLDKSKICQRKQKSKSVGQLFILLTALLLGASWRPTALTWTPF